MSTVTASVNAATAAGNAVLSFAFVPLSLAIGMTIADNTAPTVLDANATILSIDRTARQVTMNLAAKGAGVGASDSLTFTASDALDNQTLHGTIMDPAFLYRVQLAFLGKAITAIQGTPSQEHIHFCGALFNGRVSLQILAEVVLTDATNRSNCLLDVTIGGGKITDAGITAVIDTNFDAMANSRNWTV